MAFRCQPLQPSNCPPPGAQPTPCPRGDTAGLLCSTPQVEQAFLYLKERLNKLNNTPYAVPAAGPAASGETPKGAAWQDEEARLVREAGQPARLCRGWRAARAQSAASHLPRLKQPHPLATVQPTQQSPVPLPHVRPCPSMCANAGGAAPC